MFHHSFHPTMPPQTLVNHLLCLLSCKSGESPARSRQNSSSSLGATNLASSMFSHRQTSSSSTQQETPTLGLKGSKIGSSRLNSASTNNASSNIPSETVSPPNNNALPSIRGYTSFPEAINASSTRPRTPLLDPFMRSRVPPQPSTSGYGSETYSSNEAPRLGLLNDEPGPSNSYVASLAMAPLVSRPTQGGQPLYIAGGRTPDTLHAAPSSTYSTPNLHSSPAMQFTGSSHTMPKLNAAVPFSGGGTATRTGTLDSNAGLGLTPSASAGHSRPGMRHRSSSVDSYLRHDGQPALEEDLDGRTRRHERQHSSGLAGLTSFFHLRGSNSEDKGTSLSRRRSSKSRSRKGSLSNTVNTGQSGKLSSRFVHYGQPSPASRPRTPQSETRARQRSSSFGAVAPRDYQFPGRDSPTHPGTGSVAETRGRLPREYDNSRSNSAVTANSSLGRRKEEKRVRNKLISARLPENISHRDARLPSQPLGFTWICGSSSAARTPSFYEEFDYSAFPGGRRKRSMSRSTITQRNYATTGAGDSRTGSRAGVGRGSEDLAYDSEPEFLARRRARNAAGNETRGATQVDEQTQTESLEGPYPTKAQVPHLTFPTGGGALLTSQEEEKALRRRSQSLVNLRSAYARAQNSHTSGKEKERRIDDSTGNMLISHPYREHSTEFIRTPRAAPVPLPEDLGHHNGYDSGVPPLFMGESMVIPQPSARKDGAESATAWTDSKKIAGTSPALAQQAVRRAPSRASIEAIDDLEKRREALFAALPPPARRSPTPAQALSPSMYTTSKIISSGATSETEISRQEGGYIDILPQGTRQYQSEDISGSGAISPPIDDYSQFEASRVIIGQSDLLSSATAQERFPIVYGQAFSTTHESQEGEILNASSSADSLSAIARLQRDESKESNRFRDSLTPLREVETSMAMHRSQDVSGSGGSGSASRSISNGSARILDLNEESFTNLVSETTLINASIQMASTLTFVCLRETVFQGSATFQTIALFAILRFHSPFPRSVHFTCWLHAFTCSHHSRSFTDNRWSRATRLPDDI